MKSFKFMYLMLFFLFSAVGYADNDGINGTCPGEIIEEINGTAIEINHTENGAIGGGGNDRYRMTFPVQGTLTINANHRGFPMQNNADYDFYVSNTTCGNWNLVSGQTGKSHTTTVTINAGDTVWVRLKALGSRHDYALALHFVPQGAVSIVKTVNTTTPQVGEVVHFNITTTNTGVTQSIEMKDGFPDTAADPTQWRTTYDAFEDISVSNVPSGVTCSIETTNGTYVKCATVHPYAQNKSFTVTVNAKVKKSGHICNTGHAYIKTASWGAWQNHSDVCIDATPASPNQAPVASDITVTTTVNTAVATTLNGSDPDGDPIVYSIVSGPAHGALSGSDPSLTYTPDNGYVGGDSFVYQVCEDTHLTGALCTSATVTITVSAPLTAADDSYSTYSDENLTGNVLDNDNGTAIQVSSNTSPSEGSITVNSDGSFAYVPDINSTGAFTFTYTIRDASNQEATATVTININLAVFRDENLKDFEIIYTTNTYGDIKLIGNSNICEKNNAGVCIDPGTKQNNAIKAQYKDGDTVPGTTNSSSAKLNIPVGAEILWAGLYWQGVFDKDCNPGTYLHDPCDEPITDIIKLQSQEVKLGYSTDNSNLNISYKSIHADKFNWRGDDVWSYQGFADVTDFVKNNKAGWYWGADLNLQVGHYITGGSLGAWSLAVAYNDPNDSMKNLTIYHGYKALLGTSSTTFTLSGFKTPRIGDVKSTLIFFAGEGDIGLRKDGLSITNKSGVPKPLSNTKNPANNILNSSITVGGEHVGTDALYPKNGDNTIGIDIDTFDVGTSGQNIIGNDQNTTTVKMYTNGDGYFPGAFGLSTELYVPALCYGYSISVGDYIKIPHKGDIKDRRFQTDKRGDLDLQMKILIRNTEPSDFDYTASRLKLGFTPNSFTYKTGDSKVSPQQINGYIPAIETTTTGQIAIGSLGTMTTEGGTIGPEESIYSKLYYSFNKASFDGKFNVYVDANFTIDPNIPPIPYHFSTEGNGTDRIELCPTNPVYDPIWGAFNIENAVTAATDPGYERYPLFAQVAGRSYSVTLASYTKNPADNDRFTKPLDTDAKLEIELIDASNYDNNATTGYDTTCREPTSEGAGGFIDFNNTSRQTFDPASVIIGYDSALTLPSATFRIWTLTKKDPSDSKVRIMIMHPCTAQNQSACFDQVYTDNYLADETNSTNFYCKAECTSSTGSDCYDCLRFYYATPYCARDNFSIRPEGFAVSIKDSNETNGSALTPIEISKNNTSSIKEVAAGYDYQLNVTATKYGNSGKSKQYNYHFKPNNALINATSPATVKASGTLAVLEFDDVSACTDKNNTSYDIDFIDSQNIDIDPTFKNKNAGKYVYWMSDANWTRVDQGTYKYKTIFEADCKATPTDPKCSDCILGIVTAAATGEVGCTISSSGASGTYVDVPLSFNPYKFNVTDVNYTLRPDNNTSTLFMNDFSDANYYTGNNIGMQANLMAAVFEGNVTAEGKDGTTLSNFTNGCAAEDVRLNLYRTTIPTEDNLKTSFGTELQQYLQYGDINNSIDSDNKYLGKDVNMTLKKVAFSDAQEGVAIMHLYTTFKKPTKTDLTAYGVDAMNPIRIEYNDINATGDDSPSYADMQAGDYVPEGTHNYDENLTYVYGKISPQHRLYDEVEEDYKKTPLYVDVYCDDSLLTAPSDCNNTYGLTTKTKGEDEEDHWYLATLFTDALYTNFSNLGTTDIIVSYLAEEVTTPSVTADGNIIGLSNDDVDFDDAIATQNDINISVPAGSSRSTVIKVKYKPVPWLIYDDATDYYRVRFIGPSSWAGVGKAGHVTDTASSRETTQRMNW